MSGQRGQVSVIIPTFNAEAYLAETIESVWRQDWDRLEVLVVDDGSTDGSIAAAERFGARVRVVAAPHRGSAATRNLGIAEARGEYLLHLDADDLLLPRSIPVLMRRFEADSAWHIVAGRLECFRSPDMPAESAWRSVLPEGPQRGHLPGVAIVRADAFRTFGGLDESYPVNAELEWWVRARDKGARACLVDDVVLHRRIHGKNTTIRNGALIGQQQLRIVRAQLERKREAAGRMSAAPRDDAPEGEG